jgi:hypothetical protein
LLDVNENLVYVKYAGTLTPKVVFLVGSFYGPEDGGDMFL